MKVRNVACQRVFFVQMNEAKVMLESKEENNIRQMLFTKNLSALATLMTMLSSVGKRGVVVVNPLFLI
jgi:hypothetical protein